MQPWRRSSSTANHPEYMPLWASTVHRESRCTTVIKSTSIWFIIPKGSVLELALRENPWKKGKIYSHENPPPRISIFVFVLFWFSFSRGAGWNLNAMYIYIYIIYGFFYVCLIQQTTNRMGKQQKISVYKGIRGIFERLILGILWNTQYFREVDTGNIMEYAVFLESR